MTLATCLKKKKPHNLRHLNTTERRALLRIEHRQLARLGFDEAVDEATIRALCEDIAVLDMIVDVEEMIRVRYDCTRVRDMRY